MDSDQLYKMVLLLFQKEDDSMSETKTGLRLLDSLDRIVVETDNEDSVAIATITQDGVNVADGCRVRMKPNCEMESEEMNKSKILEWFTTSELVSELCEREGVETKTVVPYQDKTVSVNGPAVILVVTD